MRIRLQRRRFGQLIVVTAVTVAFSKFTEKVIAQKPPTPSYKAAPSVSEVINVTLRVNGKEQALKIEPRVTLLDALREYIGFTGTKKGCDHGQCGAYPGIVAAVREASSNQAG